MISFEIVRNDHTSKFGIENYLVEKPAISTLDNEAIFTLYNYIVSNGQTTVGQIIVLKPNLNKSVVEQIEERLGLKFVPEKTTLVFNHSSIEGESSPPKEGCLKGGVVNNKQQKPEITINSTPIRRNFIENLPYSPRLKQLAKKKRKEGILSEVLFWQQVHKGKFHKIDFDRQRVIGDFIVDFYIKHWGW